MDFNYKGTLLAVGCRDSKIRIFSEDTKKCIFSLGGDLERHFNHVLSVKFIKTEEHQHLLVSGGWDQFVHIWDIRSNQILRTIQGPFVSGEGIDIKDNKILIGSFRPKDAVQIFDINSGTENQIFKTVNKKLEIFSSQHSTLAFLVNCVQYSKNEGPPLFAVGGSGINEVRIFELESKKVIGVIRNLLQPVYCLDFANKSYNLAIGCADGSLRVFTIKAR